jgi:hypothetical protein
MARLRVSVTIERTRTNRGDVLAAAAVYNFDTGEQIADMARFKLIVTAGGPLGISGALPHYATTSAEITYHDPTDSDRNITQYIEVTEMVIRTKP